MGMINNVTATTGTAAADANMKSSMGLGKDDFLKLFVAQLQNQDPLNPTSSDQLLSQMSSITLVEQSYNQNSNLTNVLAAQQNATAMSAAGLVGATIKANGNAISFDGTNATLMQINLGAAASSAKVVITDANGSTVATTTTGALSAGNQALSWDGKDSNGTTLPAGAYSFAVSATSANGTIVPVTTYTAGTVTGVSYSGSTPMLTIGAATVNLKDIITVGG
jgi:flagellar basal-body rod modification protein FlgD